MTPEIPRAEQPLVSVIVRSMDRPTLAQALASIVAQSWPRIEVVLVNAKGEPHREVHAGHRPLRVAGDGTRLNRSQAANLGIAHPRVSCTTLPPESSSSL